MNRLRFFSAILTHYGIGQAGTSTGRALGSIVGSNLAAYTAELGGKVCNDNRNFNGILKGKFYQAPIVVFNDADLPSAVNGVAFASFIASGQTCVSGTRIIIQEQVYEEFMTRFLEKVESITRRMGNRTCSSSNMMDGWVYAELLLTNEALNPKSAMGSVISLHHLKRIEGMLERRGSSTIIAGGSRLLGKSDLDGFDFSKGSFLPPTVISGVSIEDELWQEEVFGPVVVVKRFSVSDTSPTQAGYWALNAPLF